MTRPRRARPIPEESQGTVNDAMVPGAFRGRLPIVAPVTPRQRMEARARGVTSVSNPAGRSSQIDQFTLTAGGAQDLTLTYRPIPMSWNVDLNGVGALNGTDYTISGETLSLLAALDARSGDDVQIQYDYLAGTPSTPTAAPGSTSFVGAVSSDASSGTTLTAALPTGITAGDLLVLMVRTGSTSAPTGWTNLGIPVNHYLGNSYIFWKVAGGSETAPVLTFGGTSDAHCSMAAYRGATSLGTPANAGGGPTGGNFTLPTVTMVHPGGTVAILVGVDQSVTPASGVGFPSGTTERTASASGYHQMSEIADGVATGATSPAWVLSVPDDYCSATVVELLP